MSTSPRRFITAVAPSATTWIGEALTHAFGRPERIPEALARLIERLDAVAMRNRRK